MQNPREVWSRIGSDGHEAKQAGEKRYGSGWRLFKKTKRRSTHEKGDWFFMEQNGKVYGKEARFFAEQGGLTQPWGTRWSRYSLNKRRHSCGQNA